MTVCKSGGVEYSEGALICSNGRELKCSGGSWHETGYSCLLLAEKEDQYVRLSADGLSTGEIAGTPTPALLPCIKYVLGAPYGHVRLYNSCDQCKIVTISWSDGQIQRERMNGNSHKDIPHRAQASQIIGEQNC